MVDAVHGAELPPAANGTVVVSHIITERYERDFLFKH